MGLIDKTKSLAHSLGKQATKVVRAQLYGTRPEIVSNASDPLKHTPAVGSGIHSPFDTSRRKSRGAPALKRQRSA